MFQIQNRLCKFGYCHIVNFTVQNLGKTQFKMYNLHCFQLLTATYANEKTGIQLATK